jgi:hypothetical protein
MTDTEVLVALRRAKVNYERAASLVAPFMVRKVETI